MKKLKIIQKGTYTLFRTVPLFFLSGLISCIAHYIEKQHQAETVVLDKQGSAIAGFRSAFPIVGVGSMLLGAILALMPTAFITSLVYVLAAILIVGAINQLVILVTINRIMRLPIIYWLLTLAVLAFGVIAIVAPKWIASAPLFFLGWTIVLYGIIECIDAIKMLSVQKKYKPKTDSTNSTEQPLISQTTTTNNDMHNTHEPVSKN